ncbi:MAG: hypothetical protein PHE79_05195 [Eubacteriales bacterium]|nr:hypothetical protein [Eubacteriales bacterium]
MGEAQDVERKEVMKDSAFEIGIAVSVTAAFALIFGAFYCLLNSDFSTFPAVFLKLYRYSFILLGAPFCLDALLTLVIKEPPTLEASGAIYAGTFFGAWMLYEARIFTSGSYTLPIITAFLVSFFVWKALRDVQKRK